MASRLLRPLATITLIATAIYSMTAIVHSGCEPSYSLVLKPWPMWGWNFGGSEADCYWAANNLGAPRPWWLSAHQFIYTSMENAGSGLLQTVYLIGLLATLFLLWPVLIVCALLKVARALSRKHRFDIKGA